MCATLRDTSRQNFSDGYCLRILINFKMYVCRLIPSSHSTSLTMLCQLRQRHITDGIDAVVVFILWLVRHVPVTVFSPLIAPEVPDDTHAPAGDMDAVTLQNVKARYDAVLTLWACCHPQPLCL